MKIRALFGGVAVTTPDLIKLRDLIDLREAQELVDDLAKQLRVARVALALRETDTMGRLDRGGPIEPGPWTVSITESRRRNPAWRAEYERVTSVAEAEAVLAATTPTVTRSLAVSELPSRSR